MHSPVAEINLNTMLIKLRKHADSRGKNAYASFFGSERCLLFVERIPGGRSYRKGSDANL